MLRIACVALMGLIGVGVAPTSAHARYALAPSNPVIHDPLTTSAVAFARDWWAQLGVATRCETVTVRLFDNPGAVGFAAALGPDEPVGWRCTIWVQAQIRRDARRPVPRKQRPIGRVNYLAMILHEYGHVAGLTHEDGGVMSVDPARPVSPPGGCWMWARATVAAERAG